MIRRGLFLTCSVLVVSLASGCFCSDRPLFPRFRAQAPMPYMQQPNSQPFGPCPCDCGGMGGQIMPGAGPILINPPPHPGVLENVPMGPNGTAPPAPALPSDAKPMPAGPSKEVKNTHGVQPVSLSER